MEMCLYQSLRKSELRLLGCRYKCKVLKNRSKRVVESSIGADFMILAIELAITFIYGLHHNWTHCNVEMP